MEKAAVNIAVRQRWKKGVTFVKVTVKYHYICEENGKSKKIV